MKKIAVALLALVLSAGVCAAGEDPVADAARRAREVDQASPSVDTAAPVVRGTTEVAKNVARRADKPAKVIDRLELEASQVTGNRELPKVMVIVPWKRADIGDLAGRPMNSLVDEVLQPVDREVFRREIDYYGALAPDRPQGERAVTSATTTTRPEK
jgi:hypothetical protein